jgi:tRNA (guanine37-N1)-methyltransferase
MPRRKPLHFDILSIFPDMFPGYLGASILGKAREAGLISVAAHDLRKWSTNKHRKVDDRPFGGGAGMVMSVEPFFGALRDLKAITAKGSKPTTAARAKTRVILLSAKGKTLTHAEAVRLAQYDRLILLCGRYEGVDERVAEHLADEELSIGNFVLTGGELPAMVVIDAVSRHIPGVLGDAASLAEESHAEPGRTEYPQYTRPAVFSPARGTDWPVPAALLSGDHANIAKWRREQQGSSGLSVDNPVPPAEPKTLAKSRSTKKRLK